MAVRGQTETQTNVGGDRTREAPPRPSKQFQQQELAAEAVQRYRSAVDSMNRSRDSDIVRASLAQGHGVG